MLSAIDFDDQPLLGAEEVDDVGPERHLQAKAQAIELLAAQPLPEIGLGVGAILAQRPGVAVCQAIVLHQGDKAPTLTRPH